MSAKDDRHQALLAALQRQQTMGVAELARVLDVTEMTVRRDLEVLEQDGLIERFHGGARLTPRASFEPPFVLRERMNASQKRAVAAAAAGLVRDGETVVLDGGSTGLALAAELSTRRVTICPLSLRVAWAFERSTSVTLLLPPGVARPGELSLTGSETIDYLGRHHFDRYLLTASGFTIAEGFTEWNAEDAAVKRAALASAATCVAAVDAGKFGRLAFADVCAIDKPDCVVTSDDLPGGALSALQQATQSVHLAS
ncbi:DeoR/GlpR family DNA-binding transcription regulator [Curtobacterium sp. NPDC089185]|uniref:DeoR/GlpR family DNA-binding transcription regulator n=1 Tax=Curtobacterium sp. NPDC089185 TaxID=3154968 RepID=UPI003416642A